MTNTIKLVALAAIILAPVGAFLLGDYRGYQRGEAETETRLTEAYNAAADELLDDAEKARFARLQCLASGGVYEFWSGQCSTRGSN